MNVLLPKAATVDVHQDPDGTWSLVYVESFDPKTPNIRKIGRDSVAAITKVLGKQKGLSIKLLDPYRLEFKRWGATREAVGAYIASEFMNWSKVGDLTVRELFALAGGGNLLK